MTSILSVNIVLTHTKGSFGKKDISRFLLFPIVFGPLITKMTIKTQPGLRCGSEYGILHNFYNLPFCQIPGPAVTKSCVEMQ